MKMGCLVREREREGKACGGGVRLTSEIRGDGNIYLASGRHNGCLVLCGVMVLYTAFYLLMLLEHAGKGLWRRV